MPMLRCVSANAPNSIVSLCDKGVGAVSAAHTLYVPGEGSEHTAETAARLCPSVGPKVDLLRGRESIKSCL
jgi:hypothetical protein